MHKDSAAIAATEIGSAAILVPARDDASMICAPHSDIGIAEGVPGRSVAQSDHFLRDPFSDTQMVRMRDLGRQRQFCIVQQGRMNKATQSYLAYQMGAGGLSKGERKKVYARAATLMEIVVLEIKSGNLDVHRRWRKYAGDKAEALRNEMGTQDLNTLEANYEIIAINDASRAPWDNLREQAERQMVGLASKLPASSFVENVLGVSQLGLAVIVAEAGDPTAYRTKHTFCKRLGVGVVDGVRQGGIPKTSSKEDWQRHGINKQRKAQVYAFLYDTMIRAQWRGAKDGEPAYPLGPYGAIYGEHKAIYLAREWEPKRADLAARRYAAKCFLRDLRKAWREACAENGSDGDCLLAVAEETIHDEAAE